LPAFDSARVKTAKYNAVGDRRAGQTNFQDCRVQTSGTRSFRLLM
jgi:hypothetical protein